MGIAGSGPAVADQRLCVVGPPEQSRPGAGRYRETSDAHIFIVDGQQRSTALAGGAGIKPACYPADIWNELGGPNLQVGVVLESTRRLGIHPMRSRIHPQIALGALLRARPADIPDLVGRAGAGTRTREASQLAAELTSMRDRLLETSIPVAWSQGGVRDAAESYRVLGFDKSRPRVGDRKPLPRPCLPRDSPRGSRPAASVRRPVGIQERHNRPDDQRSRPASLADAQPTAISGEG